MSALVWSPLPRRRVLAGALVPAFLALAACGSTATQAGEPTTSAAVPSPTPSSDLPACADIWVAGKQLAADYKGCQDSGTAADDVTTDCSMGNTLVQHGSDLYATPGRQIRQADGGFRADAAFQRLYELCTG